MPPPTQYLAKTIRTYFLKKIYVQYVYLLYQQGVSREKRFLRKDIVGSNEDAQQWGSQCQHKPITVCGPVFADDARWMDNTREGILKAAEISEDFLGFHGGINNIPKSTDGKKQSVERTEPKLCNRRYIGNGQGKD